MDPRENFLIVILVNQCTLNLVALTSLSLCTATLRLEILQAFEVEMKETLTLFHCKWVTMKSKHVDLDQKDDVNVPLFHLRSFVLVFVQ